jgi:CHASE2 domain-containing sensor protein
VEDYEWVPPEIIDQPPVQDISWKIIRRRNMIIGGVTFFMFLASWGGLFDRWYLPDLLEHELVHLGNSLSPPPWADSIVVIGVDHETKAAELRRSYAQILPRLAKAGARVIALDYYYDRESPSPHDDVFAQSIQQARKQGSDVIVGVRNPIKNSEGELNLIPALEKAASAWGVGENVLECEPKI